jgi:hypothetical protein
MYIEDPCKHCGRSKSPLSMGEMKRRVFKMIGYAGGAGWGNTINRTEMLAIYEWIKKRFEATDVRNKD